MAGAGARFERIHNVWCVSRFAGAWISRRKREIHAMELLWNLELGIWNFSRRISLALRHLKC